MPLRTIVTHEGSSRPVGFWKESRKSFPSPARRLTPGQVGKGYIGQCTPNGSNGRFWHKRYLIGERRRDWVIGGGRRGFCLARCTVQHNESGRRAAEEQHRKWKREG
ncbi:hypothetical protein BX070DRAFT_141523 [Coemansia spiralis]|nr:hypothetical protein BX070DRAFT_141523 [Coemansia spiralis]